MSFQIKIKRKFLETNVTFKRFFSRMNQFVTFKLWVVQKAFATVWMIANELILKTLPIFLHGLEDVFNRLLHQWTTFGKAHILDFLFKNRWSYPHLLINPMILPSCSFRVSTHFDFRGAAWSFYHVGIIMLPLYWWVQLWGLTHLCEAFKMLSFKICLDWSLELKTQGFWSSRPKLQFPWF